MSRSDPLITAEELQCLLGDRPAQNDLLGQRLASHPQNPETLLKLQLGAALWLFKGVLLCAVLMSPEAANLANASRYLWMRGSLEVLCLLVFAVTCLRPQTHTRTLANGSPLVASTTLLMDAMSLLAVPG